MEMIEIDGSHGGGQLLRTALTLSMVTGESFSMSGIRAGRSRPGLMRQHLTAIEAARQVSGAVLSGAEPGSQTLSFAPQAVRAGNYHFPIGTAGSTTLVLQTVLPALCRADQPSTLRLEGGTHNPLAPPADFLADTFAPALAKMGVSTDIRFERHGFYPAGGGILHAAVTPANALQALHLPARGALRSIVAKVVISGIPISVAQRELKVVTRRLPEAAHALHEIKRAIGPGNALIIRVESEHIVETFTAFGERGVSAEHVAEQVCDEVQAYLKSKVAVGPYLADQLLLPMALAGSGSFTTSAPTAHLRSNAALIEKFLPVQIDYAESTPGVWNVEIS
jgi:RNA 3'-terminal phosphate cyclase (ATP)